MALSYGFVVPDAKTDSQAFSEAIHALFGDGITTQGGQYELSLGGGFAVGLATGYTIANGRFIKHDEPFSLAIPPSGNYADRYDAIAARVDYPERAAEIKVLKDIDPENPVRNNEEYNVFLYIIRVRRGATTLKDEDVRDVRADADLCGRITPLSDVAGDVYYIYNFLESGIDETVAGLKKKAEEILRRLVEKVEELVSRAGSEVEKLEARISAIEGRTIGDMEMSRVQPSPSNEWLLCDGTAVPAQYPELSELLHGTLPDISNIEDRYRTYIYGGAPVEV